MTRPVASAGAAISDRPIASATIVLYNSADYLADCLASVRTAVESGLAEVIAIDNASPDNSAQIVSEQLPTATLIQLPGNRGFAAGANVGLRQARGSYWLLLNPDVVLPENGLADLVAWMEVNTEIGIASPEIAGADGRLHASGRAFPSVALALLELSRLHKLLPRRLRARLLKGPYSVEGDQLNAGWVPGTVMIARSEAVASVGALCEDFFMYGEDIEWCWRFHAAGWKVGVCGQVVARHQQRASAARTWDARETERRMAQGTLAAVRMQRGHRYSQLYARVLLCSLWIEAHHPLRSRTSRMKSSAAFDAWSAAVHGT